MRMILRRDGKTPSDKNSVHVPAFVDLTSCEASRFEVRNCHFHAFTRVLTI